MRLRKRAYRALMELRRRLLCIPPPGQVNFGDLRRTGPISRSFGTDRGLPLDRYYIERFLEGHARDVCGCVLEAEDDAYTRRFGCERVERADVLHVRDGNPRATVIADLACAPHLADASYDAVVLTQVLHMVYDAPSAVRTIHRLLRPGGVLLLTVPGIGPIPTSSIWGYTWYWSFTPLAIERMLGDVFGPSAVEVRVGGNVLAATAFLHGMAASELSPDELDAVDPDYPVIVMARARRPLAGG